MNIHITEKDKGSHGIDKNNPMINKKNTLDDEYQNLLGKINTITDSPHILNESSSDINKQQKFQLPNTSQEKIVLENKSKQFKFDCGVIMGRIDMDINNKFGLKWHFKNTTNIDEFIKSVSNFIAVSGNSITEKDKQNLIKQYSKG